ncbi:MAG: YfiR family protein [bacterium]
MKKVIIMFFLMLFSSNIFSQMSIPKAQSLFLVNFIRLIEWNDNIDKYNIYIYGNSDVYDELVKIISHKKDINVININELNEIKDMNSVHILFISYTKRNISDDIFNNKNTLFISENRSLSNKVGICFYIDDNKLVYELNQNNINKNNIKISSQVINLANKVK